MKQLFSPLSALSCRNRRTARLKLRIVLSLGTSWPAVKIFTHSSESGTSCTHRSAHVTINHCYTEEETMLTGVFMHLWLIVACGVRQVDDQTQFFIFFIQSVQQLEGTEHIRTWKLLVQSLKKTHFYMLLVSLLKKPQSVEMQTALLTLWK